MVGKTTPRIKGHFLCVSEKDSITKYYTILCSSIGQWQALRSVSLKVIRVHWSVEELIKYMSHSTVQSTYQKEIAGIVMTDCDFKGL